jgi:xylose isomerase
VRRQSIDPEDLVTAHAHAIDLCARGLLVAEKMIADGELGARIEARYAGWNGKLGRGIVSGKMSLDRLAKHIEKDAIEPGPRSGRQELLESIVNNYI